MAALVRLEQCLDLLVDMIWNSLQPPKSACGPFSSLLPGPGRGIISPPLQAPFLPLFKSTQAFPPMWLGKNYGDHGDHKKLRKKKLFMHVMKFQVDGDVRRKRELWWRTNDEQIR